jgi:hypothetical protein
VPGIVDRVAVEALNVRPVRTLVTLLTLPFVVLGFVIGVLWLVVRFAYAAVKVGMAEAQARIAVPVPAPSPPAIDEAT